MVKRRDAHTWGYLIHIKKVVCSSLVSRVMRCQVNRFWDITLRSHQTDWWRRLHSTLVVDPVQHRLKTAVASVSSRYDTVKFYIGHWQLFQTLLLRCCCKHNRIANVFTYSDICFFSSWLPFLTTWLLSNERKKPVNPKWNNKPCSVCHVEAEQNTQLIYN